MTNLEDAMEPKPRLPEMKGGNCADFLDEPATARRKVSNKKEVSDKKIQDELVECENRQTYATHVGLSAPHSRLRFCAHVKSRVLRVGSRDLRGVVLSLDCCV